MENERPHILPCLQHIRLAGTVLLCRYRGRRGEGGRKEHIWLFDLRHRSLRLCRTMGVCFLVVQPCRNQHKER
jgi:hypothetical protein